jgi:hypothetical protein
LDGNKKEHILRKKYNKILFLMEDMLIDKKTGEGRKWET